VPADNEDAPEPLYCTFCDRRAAKPVAGPPLCIKCVHDGAKRHAERRLPTDPAILYGLSQLFSAS
jgi:hypothetical protein